MAMHRRRYRGPTVSIGLGGLGSLLIPVAIVAGLGYGVYWLVGEMDRKAHQGVKESVAATPKRPLGKASPREARVSPGDARAGLDQAAADVNVAVLFKESARYAGDTAGLSNRAATAANARAVYERLASGAATPPEALETTDEVLAVDDVDLAALKPADAAAWLAGLVERISPASSYRVRVKRGGGEVSVYLTFAHGVRGASASRTEDRIPISNEFALEVQKQVLSLPPNQLSPAERRDIETVLGRGEATREELDLIRRRLQGGVVVATNREKDRGEFERAAKLLEGMLPTAPVPEAVITKDGRRFVGRITGETQSSITVSTLVGPMTVPLEEVKEKITAKELRDEFQRRFLTGEKYRESYLQLLTWTREWDMPVHREYVACTLLIGDPGDRVARMAAGYFQAPNGDWMPTQSIAAGAKIPQKKIESKAEAKAELESMGFVLKGSSWFTRSPWEDGIETLHRPGKAKITYSGASILAWQVDDTPKYRSTKEATKLKLNSPALLRFIAPQGTQGTATISFEAPGELQELQVRATGGVLDEGPRGVRLEVWVTPEGGRSHVLYDIDTGSNAVWHDASAHVRGKRRFTVTCRMTTVKDSYHAYARFLPSMPETKDVLGVRGTILKPAPEVDRMWSALR